MKFKCECGFELEMKPNEFPLHCKCGKTNYYYKKSASIPPLSKRIDLSQQHDDTFLNSVTACITTYRRPGCLERLVKSIKKYYPNLKIDIIDTEGNLSWGRNQLVQRCETDYCLILEDDFEFVDDTKIEPFLDILKFDNTLGLVGGEIYKDSAIKHIIGVDLRWFRGNLEYSFYHHPVWLFCDKIRYRYCDMVSNFFLAKRQCLLDHPWDEDLELMEHTPWFWTLKQEGQYKVAYTDCSSINHYRDRSDPEYNERRNNIKKYNTIIEKKYNIRRSSYVKSIPEIKNILHDNNNSLEVYSVWIGDRLPRLQNLCIKSWLMKGYKYKLFVYEDVENIPDGVDVLDGSEFIKEIYRYQNENNYNEPSLHGNYFRYKWLYKNGGIWLDIDTACINKLPDSAIIFSSEPLRCEPFWHPNVAVTKVPAKNKIIEKCLYHTEKQINKGCLDKGFFGPQLIKYALAQDERSTNFIFPPETFCPHPCWLTRELYQPYALPVPIQSVGIHLWNAMTVRKQINVDGIFDKNSLYERLWEYLGIR